MKRILCLIVVLVLCVAASGSVFAENSFVPSISYKDVPVFGEAVLGPQGDTPQGENIADCIIISSITDAREKTTDIFQSARDLLLDTYEKLKANSMELPLDGNKYVIRELVDVSFKKTPCIEAEHIHEEELNKIGVVISIDFDLGIKAETDLVVLSYHNGQWDPALSVQNNGDGTVTVVLEHFCPVAFCVEKTSAPPQTGDNSLTNLYFWIAAMAVSFAGLMFLAVSRRKKGEKEPKR